MNLTTVVQCQSATFIRILANSLESFATSNFYNDWQQTLKNAATVAQSYTPTYSQMLAVKRFHTLLQQNNYAKHSFTETVRQFAWAIFIRLTSYS